MLLLLFLRRRGIKGWVIHPEKDCIEEYSID